MNAFEQEVAEALRTIKFSGGTAGLVALPMDDEYIERLAPRVAAAIDAAAGASRRNTMNLDPWDEGNAIETAALAALRGDSPEKSPERK